jgi:hypothetical protein
MTNTKLYEVWKAMKKRCFNKNCKIYADYGGRGITVCEEWVSDFVSFYNWSMQNGYAEGLTIDRIDNDGNYEPSNCRWTTHDVQIKNRRKYKNSVDVEINGETKTLMEWSKLTGISYNTLHKRIRLGWQGEKIIS